MKQIIKKKIPLSYQLGRELSDKEIEQVNGAGHTGTITPAVGGPIPGRPTFGGDVDYDYTW